MPRFKIFLVLAVVIAGFVAASILISLKSEFVALDVGQGDALFSKSGTTQALVDTGPNRNVLYGLGRSMPFFDRTIECVFITHSHKDHYGGLTAVVNQYDVKNIFISDDQDKGANWLELLKDIKNRKIPVVVIGRGNVVRCGPMQFSVLWPYQNVSFKDQNDASLVMKLNFDNISRQILLMGDAGFSAEEEMMLRKDSIKSAVLKVGHHGSKYSTSEAFIKQVKPDFAVISLGKNNYGHPNNGVVDRLVDMGVKVLRTDKNKDFYFKMDGRVDLFSKFLYAFANYY